MKNARKYSFVLILMALLCVVMLFTYSFESGIEADHECGEHFCRICFGLSVLEYIRDSLGAVMFAFVFAGAICLFVYVGLCLCKKIIAAPTPVCLKVKLLN